MNNSYNNHLWGAVGTTSAVAFKLPAQSRPEEQLENGRNWIPTYPPYGYVIKEFESIWVGQNLLWQKGHALHI